MNKSKKGVASLIVVIFTTMLLGIISIGFVNIMLSEATQTVNYDLSQSAYDSALAGVEDAKIALLKYHQCLSGRLDASDPGPGCTEVIGWMTTNYNEEDCDIVSKMLLRPNKDENGNPISETIIQTESGGNVRAEGTEIMEQAYTCVRITENTDDYLGTLNGNYKSKIIPIRTDNVGSVDRIRLEWYNTEDSVKRAPHSGSGDLITNKEGFTGTVGKYSNTNIFGTTPLAPSVVQFQLLQTAERFVLSNFNTNSSGATNRGSLILRPSSSSSAVRVIANSANTGLAASADRSFNNPIDVKCDDNAPSYRCVADISIPNPISGSGSGASGGRNTGTMFVRLVLPYGAPDTSFSLTLYDCSSRGVNPNNTGVESTSGCAAKKFAGVQTAIDSTGRANDLFRRVEARVEMVDIYYPFPEFAIETNGGGGDDIWKNFWVTVPSPYCWLTNSTSAHPYGTTTSCPSIQRLGG